MDLNTAVLTLHLGGVGEITGCRDRVQRTDGFVLPGLSRMIRTPRSHVPSWATVAAWLTREEFIIASPPSSGQPPSATYLASSSTQLSY